jgi:hypothetical protein
MTGSDQQIASNHRRCVVVAGSSIERRKIAQPTVRTKRGDRFMFD